ncbi:MAG: UDP-N-acetylmuramoylalanine--D-glutamate ligase [Bdellovibrionales bacterium RIFCSPHIGHO2_01_FULL_40_29]|nr:MAG: UDP-N-acetylmuramoylalanine--D-glutamate ligase [Bdellovibrionales bacterium RIFCSPHIGHO2_01_FULL_40_29]OFZ33180.1 MAG: UDP-N-acetylmuramoylalanine--D-glutamate ligase [Bdellovibrionales bacterium RIFCSPHIGHO2_02_FULL_40_15]
MGKSGSAAMTLLKFVGYHDSDLLSYDEKDSSATFSDSSALLRMNPKTLVVSPGVPLSLPWIQTLLQNGAMLTSEISLASSVLENEKLIGVTGSVGKSTVVSILGAGAKHEDENGFVGGNLGTPFCIYALNVLSGAPRAKWIILELSSYQLENCEKLHLDFSAITFLSANHLERYSGISDYYSTKMKITARTKSVCVFNSTSVDAVIAAKNSDCPVLLARAATDLSSDEIEKVSLLGKHNHDNFAVAHKLAMLAQWSTAAIDKMYSFKGLPHRLETVGYYNGIFFVNDSKATAMDSVHVATNACLDKVSSSNRLLLLLGGKDKNLPWHDLSTLGNNPKIDFVFFGSVRTIAQTGSGLKGPSFPGLHEALEFCFKSAKSGDVVLLSPGGTSLDEFKNFEDRGEFFKKKIQSFFIQ